MHCPTGSRIFGTGRASDNPALAARDRSHIHKDVAGEGGKAPMDRLRDQDQGKGATEQDQKNQGGNTNMSGQLGHRDEDAELKNADSDLSG